MLTQEYLKSILHYDHRSGNFHYLSDGSLAGSLHKSGYIRIKVNGHGYFAHRLAWLYVYGVWPQGQIDHIDHNKADNGMANLREASTEIQSKNRPQPKNNTSGITGVYFHTSKRKWLAQIRIGRKKIHLGCFVRFEDAVSARVAAEIQYDFHLNHGQ